MRHLMRRLTVAVTVAAAFIVGPGLAANAADTLTTRVVQNAVGSDVIIREVTGEVSLTGVVLTAPPDRTAFASIDSLIAALQTGQTTATFGLPAPAEVLEDGSVLITNAYEGVRMQSMLDRPWAKDADGKDLPTWYTLDATGTALTQHVDTTGAKYPIAADPRLTFGWGVYLNIAGYEFKAIASAVLAVGGAGAITACSGLTKFPTVLARVVAVLCTAVGVPTIRSILNSIVNVWKSTSIANYDCYQKRIVGPSSGWYKVAWRNCG